MPIKISVNGDLRHTKSFLVKALKPNWRSILTSYGEKGIVALANATPKDTGNTSKQWGFEIVKKQDSITIFWINDHVEKGWANIAILLQYGHATRNGGYVEGVDYINPAIKPIFDKMAKDMWEAIVT